MNEILTDEEVVTAVVIHGKRDLYETLIDRHKQMIFGMLYRFLGGNKEPAEELAHEAFVKAYLNLKSFRSDARFSTWLARIALNTAHAHFSSRAEKQLAQNEDLDMAKDAIGFHGNENLAERKEKLISLQRALTKLAPVYKEIINLCAIEKKSYAEVSHILEIPIGTVRSRLNKARLLMKTEMQKEVLEETV